MNPSLRFLGVFLTMSVFLCACQKDEPAAVCDPAAGNEPYVLDVGPFPEPLLADDNLLTTAGVQLGRMLFYEPRLSLLDNQSCASCHRQEHAFTDTAKFSVGTLGDVGDRQAMAAFNLAWNTEGFFWDGRSPSLRHQSLQPIENPVEMAETHEQVIEKLEADPMYVSQFEAAFGDGAITAERMGLAMEQFMTTIVSNRSKFDRVQAGLDTFTESEQRGRDLYFTEYNPFFPETSGADCAHCHGGFNFENDQYLNNGLDTDASMTDLGYFLVTGNEADRGKFKVTSLRNIELTAPYMHDGRFASLEAVVEHYNSGIQSSSTVDPTVLNTQETGLMLTPQDKTDLINFLKTLTDFELLTDERYSDPF